MIQGRTVAAWVNEVEISGFPSRATDVLNDAGPRVMPDLAKVLRESKSPQEQAKAAFAMSGICYRNPNAPEVHDVVRPLIISAKDTDSEVQIYSIQALGAIGKAANVALPSLIQLTTHTNASVRTCAVEALGRIGVDSPESLTALKTAASDTSDDVRITATKALELLHSDQK